jgi:hypothetical protein
MDPTFARLETPDECDQYAANVTTKFPELAQEARRRGIELRAAAHGAKNTAEREALAAIYAYEEALFVKHGKRLKAAYTWRKIKKDGIIKAVEHVVSQRLDPGGYKTIREMGLKDLTFEAVVLRHPTVFSAKAVERSKKRLEEWEE